MVANTAMPEIQIDLGTIVVSTTLTAPEYGLQVKD